MTAWHLLKHLNCTLAAHSPVTTTLSRRLIRASPSPSPLNRFISSLNFLSNHCIVWDQWPAHIHTENIHAADAHFSTASSSSSSSLVNHPLDAPVPAPATYRSVLIHCHKDTAESFHPIEVTEGLWVVPKWITPPDVHATNIILNPGLAFGTGEHPTTKLCILFLHGCIKGGEYILDYGTGTGILALAAIKFGAAFAVGIDVDSQAIASASQNAALNNVGPDKLQLHLIASQTSSSSSADWPFGVVAGENASGIETVTEKDKYDVVIANILLNPLLDLADQIISCAKPGAIIGLSGILCEQVQYIIQRYSPFLEGIEMSKMDDWACVSGRKKNLDVC